MHIHRIIAASLLSLLAACGQAPAPAASAGTHASASANATPDSSSQGNAVTRIGDVSIRASVVQTSELNETIARQYGLQRDPKTVMLLVTVSQGPDATATALPASISATVTDLRDSTQPLVMHEVRDGDAIDYIGTTSTSLPDTLRFDIDIVRAGGARSSMSLSRDFYPR